MSAMLIEKSGIPFREKVSAGVYRLKRMLLRPFVSILDTGAGKPLVAHLPRAIDWMPGKFRPRSYWLALQNLPLFGFDEATCHARACRHVAVNLVRHINLFSFETHDPDLGRARAGRVGWIDPGAAWSKLQLRPTMIVMVHTGDYRAAVGCIAVRMSEPRHFFIPSLGGEDNPAYDAIKSLENFGHTVEVADSNDTRLSMRLARALRKGAQVIMFSDLPSNYGATHFGEPMPCRLFGRNAQMVGGAVTLASRTDHDILLAGHRVELGGDGFMHLFGHIEAGEEEAMRQEFVSSLSAFLSEEPENWLYLSIMESYFHRQLSTSAERTLSSTTLAGANG